MAKQQREPKRGPEPERLKIKGGWEKAVDKALKKRRPPDGWPKLRGKRGTRQRGP
jgi:hypothetical protein